MLSKEIKKSIPFDRAIEETLKILEKRWPFLYLSAHAYKMVITTVCVQIDNCFCELLSISVRH